MQKTGYLSRAVSSKGDALFTFIDITGLISSLGRERKLEKREKLLFGQALTVCAYLASFLKSDEEFLTLSLSLGAGEGKKISLSASGKLSLSGCIREGKGENKGYFSVIRFYEGRPVSSLSETESADIPREFSKYYSSSEQRTCFLSLSEGEAQICGGVFLEALPGAEEEKLKMLFEKMRAGEVFQNFFSEGEVSFPAPFEGENAARRKITFRCRCTRARALSSVLSLQREDALSLLKERGQIEVCCPECGKKYTFSQEEILNIFDKNGR